MTELFLPSHDTKDKTTIVSKKRTSTLDGTLRALPLFPCVNR